MARGGNDTDSAEMMRPSVKVNATLDLPLAEFQFRVSRSSGPGGQHANKSETRVEALFDVLASESLTDGQRSRLLERVGPVVRAVAQDERSQFRNKELATQRVAEQIANALLTRKRRRPTAPSESAVTRRLDSKRHRSQVKRLRGKPVDD